MVSAISFSCYSFLLHSISGSPTEGKLMLRSLLSDQSWLQTLAATQPHVAELISERPEHQQRAGYFHTLSEIAQQPSTWIDTAKRMISGSEGLARSLAGVQSLVLTGSGSSAFAGECVCAPVRRELGIVTEAIGGGTLLTYGSAALPPARSTAIVSLGRSGDSPESVGAMSRLLRSDPAVRHLVITCNPHGALALDFRDHPNVHVIALDEATNDRSLVMTSSFTNLTLAARFLGLLNSPERYCVLCEKLGLVANHLLRNYFGVMAAVAQRGFRRVVFLGSGARLGAARESALKVLEMTAGAVPTLCDSYLGLRHGPMSFIDSDTLIVGFLSSDPVVRAYESDLLRELDQKKLGLGKVIVGENIPHDILREDDMALDCPGLGGIEDDDTPVVHVIVGQLLAFFRCLEEGLQPDSPSKAGVITRVVPGFKLHFSSAARDKENDG
jgi:D-galactosamine 6-phosphate deaminase/isomerase